MAEQKKILLTVPNMGWIHRAVCDALDEIRAKTVHLISVMRPTCEPPLDNALNKLADLFHNSDADFWLTFDDDTYPKRTDIDPLIDLDKPVIGLPYTMCKESGQDAQFFPAVFDIVDSKHKRHYPEVGVQKVDALGGGALLIAKRVFDNAEMRKYPFLSEYNEKGFRVLGPDLSFCARLRHNNVALYAHYDYPCGHYKELDISTFQGVL